MRIPLLMTALLCLGPGANAVPMQLHQHGRLLDNSGSAIEGQLDMTFTLFDALSGGAILWQENQTLTFTNGYYSAILGANGQAQTP